MNAIAQKCKKELAALRRKYPLPKSVPDTEFNLGQIAQFMGVSTTTINTWLSQGLPYLQKGGNGNEYKFRGGDVWAWKRAREADDDQRDKAAKKAIQAMQLELIGGGLGSSIEALTPREKKEIVAAQREIEGLQADRHELLIRDEVRDALEEIFAIWRDANEALPDAISREERLSAKQIAVIAKHCDRSLEFAIERIKRFWSERPKGKRKHREHLFELN